MPTAVPLTDTPGLARDGLCEQRASGGVGRGESELYLLGRRRAFELAAMAAVGLRRRQLIASVLTEQGLVLGTGTFASVAAGLLAVHFALPAVPEFSDGYNVPALLLTPNPLFITAMLTAIAALLAAGITSSATQLVTSAAAGRLGETQP